MLLTAAVAKEKRNAKGLYDWIQQLDPSIVSLTAAMERLGSRPSVWFNVSTSKENRHHTSDEDRRANPTRESIKGKGRGIGK